MGEDSGLGGSAGGRRRTCTAGILPPKAHRIRRATRGASRAGTGEDCGAFSCARLREYARWRRLGRTDRARGRPTLSYSAADSAVLSMPPLLATAADPPPPEEYTPADAQHSSSASDCRQLPPACGLGEEMKFSRSPGQNAGSSCCVAAVTVDGAAGPARHEPPLRAPCSL